MTTAELRHRIGDRIDERLRELHRTLHRLSCDRIADITAVTRVS